MTAADYAWTALGGVLGVSCGFGLGYLLMRYANRERP